MKLTNLFIGFTLTSLGLQSCGEETVSKPNVLLIMVDDQGYGDVGSLGNEYIKTPNIDKLYEVSARFTDYHVGTTSAPTRAAILTGRHPNKTGVWHTVNGRSLLLERETTMAQIFKENGYNTAIFGKWHLGDNYPFRPEDNGFDEVLVHNGGGIGQTMDYWDNDYFDDTYIHNGVLKEFEGYCTDVWFENAKKFIDSKKDEPFFCYLSTNAAHSPYNVADKYAAPYKDNENIPNANFYGMIANIDENIGKMIEYLESEDLMDNTIIIFTTDNGTSAGAKVEGHRLDGFVVNGNNHGMRGIKASMYEGGHRVPLFIYWKQGGIKTGKDINELTAHYDVLPTLAELCKLNVNDQLEFDGSSLVPLINGNDEAFKDRIVVVNSQRIEVPEAWRRTSLMKNNWRLINGEELYDLGTDPEQRVDVADKYPEIMESLKAEYDKWWDEVSPYHEEQPYIIIGNKRENPATLYCHDWHSDKDSPWHQRHIRDGYIDNGHWLVKVDESGTYQFRLRRWPETTGLALDESAPIRPAIPNTSVSESKKGKPLNIQKARIVVQGIELTKDVTPGEKYVEFTIELEKGETELKTWFTLEDQIEIGAYFVGVKKI